MKCKIGRGWYFPTPIAQQCSDGFSQDHMYFAWDSASENKLMNNVSDISLHRGI